MGLLDAIAGLVKDAIANPEVRRFAGRVMASGAQPCKAPNCPGSSLPGIACIACGAAMCNTHAHAFLVAAPPKPHCPPCAMALWNADADESEPAHKPTPIIQPKALKRKKRS